MKVNGTCRPRMNGPVSSKSQICTGGEFTSPDASCAVAFSDTHARTFFLFFNHAKSVNASPFIHVSMLREPGLVSETNIRLLVKHVMHLRAISMLPCLSSCSCCFSVTHLLTYCCYPCSWLSNSPRHQSMFSWQLRLHHSY